MEKKDLVIMKKNDVRKKCIKSYVTLEEHAKLQKMAKQCGLSVSEYIRRIATDKQIKSMVDREAFLSALKVNADLGRLGGLFKYYISKGFRNVSHGEIRRLLHQIESRQRDLSPIISKIRQTL